VKDHVKVRDGQERVGLRLHPGVAVGSLARGTMPVAAGVRHELLRAALTALVQMSAEFRRAAGHNRSQHPPVMRGQAMIADVGRQAHAHDFGHRQAGAGGDWPAEAGIGGRPQVVEQNGRRSIASSGALEFGDERATDMQIAGRGGEITVTEQSLDHRQRHARSSRWVAKL